MVIQRYCIANAACVAAELFPTLVTKNGNGIAVWCGIFLRQKCAPEKWPQFKKVKVISAHHLAEDIGSLAAPRHACDSKAVTGHSGEHAVLFPVIEKIEIRILVTSSEMSISRENLYYPLRMPDGKRAEQQRVNDSEDSSVDSDPKGNRDKGDGEKSRRPD